MITCKFFRIVGFILLVPILGVAQSVTDLSNALDALHNHVAGASTLSPAELKIQEAEVIANNIFFGSNGEMIESALEVVSAYESSRGPLWLNDATRNVTIPREQTGGLELEMAMIAVMQGLLDHAYTPENLSRFREALDGAMYETSRYFPGAVDPPADPSVSYDVKINASQPAAWGSPVMYDDEPTRRPTGCYVAPGSIVTVTVPASMAGEGYSIRVGAHSWDLSNKPRYERLDRVSILYPITESQTLIANPLGGGIYIEVPVSANAGIVTITITNAVRSPFYSKKPFHMTSLSEWQDTERNYPAPWADFESEKFMMQVPTGWIYAFDSPDITMENWDKAIDLVSDLMGKPRVRNGKTVLYMQIDVIIRGGAYYPGYPMSNDTYDPLRNEYGNKDHYFLTGPRKGTSTVFHELGHAQLFTKFSGETEAVVNLLYVAVMNQGFGYSLDRAFSLSMGNKEQLSLDQAAIMWMVTENFRQGNPMDITNSTKNEVRYQQRGYAKYVEIAKNFGWDALNDFWYSVNTDYMNGIEYNRNNDEADSRMLRMSRTAGADLRPLVHFWGVHPNNDDELKTAMQNDGWMPSALIYDQLMHYKTLIPMNNAEFVAHADIVYPERDGSGDPDYGKGWYSVWDKLYNESHGTAAQTAMQNIIDYYFPNGRPNAEKYDLTVNNGYGEGSYLLGQVVTIIADSPQSGEEFVRWQVNSGSPTIANVNSPTTTLTMGSEAATITATYKNIDDVTTVKVFIMAGQSNMQGMGTVTPTSDHLNRNGGKGTLEYLVDDPSQAPAYDHLVTNDGEWVEREDVWIVDLDRSGPLTVGYGVDESHIGPEMQFGHVIGDYYENQVLIIKTSWGGKSLYTEFRPPSSGGELGPYYTIMVERIHEVLDNIGQFMPGYQDQGYEIAGFGWHQGWNDRVSQTANDEYQTNCVNLINDLRDEFQLPDMPFVLATTGMSGWNETHPRALSLMEAQLAVPEDDRLNTGNVVALETRDFWREVDDSPADQGYHWNRNAETYFLIGNGMGEAMVELRSQYEISDTSGEIETKNAPDGFFLSQNYPNPFNPSTTISYEIAGQSRVTVKVYDVLGKLITTLVDGIRSEGSYTVQFDASDLPSGIYILQMNAGDYLGIRKMTLIK